MSTQNKYHEESQEGAKAVLDRMMKILGSHVGSYAEVLDLSSNTIKTWIRRGAVPMKYIQGFANKHNVSVDYVMRGVEGREAAQMIQNETLIAQPKLANLSKEVFGDAPARHSQNPNTEFEARLKRVAFATHTPARIYKELGFVPGDDGVYLLQTLLFSHGLDEAGARLIVEYMKRQENNQVELK